VANFPPLKNHLLRCVDGLIDLHGVEGPFLDAGCGGGDVSRHLAQRGWMGVALDDSAEAVERARRLLAGTPVRIETGSLFAHDGAYGSVFALDVIEHLEDDAAALNRLASLLRPGGHLIVSVPSNPQEWRWDDDVFGHYRRYTESDLRAKLRRAGLEPLEVWDFTYPVFWAMRRLYTRLKRSPEITGTPDERTRRSSGENPWSIPLVSALLSGDHFVWRWISRLQFDRHRLRTDRGHEIVAVARKRSAS
jgi:SAM-dependent methyltransferase